MTGIALTEHELQCLQQIIDDCRELGDEPIPGRVLECLGVLLDTRAGGGDLTERDRFVLAVLRPHLEDHYRRWQREHPPSAGLTERQLAVMSLVRDGYTNEQIARRLHVSEGTVRTHLNHVYERLGVASRTAAVTAVYGEAGP